MQIRYLHPSKLVNDTIPNRVHNQRLENLLALRLETKIVNRQEQECVVLRHEEFPNAELHCVKRWVRVDQEGAGCDLFESPEPTEQQANEVENDEGQEEIPVFIRNAHVDNIQAV